MIVYGTKSKELAKEVVMDKCSNCGAQGSIYMHVFQKYAHLFWIPFFPMGKTGISQCEKCKKTLKQKEMPSSLLMEYDSLKAKTKTPIWMFSGLVVVAILITIGIVDDKNKDARNSELILSPQTGDIFEIETKADQYTLYKVNQIVGDSIFVLPSKYETNKITGISDLIDKGDNSFSDDVLGFSKSELKQMVANGEIYNIDRK